MIQWLWTDFGNYRFQPQRSFGSQLPGGKDVWWRKLRLVAEDAAAQLPLWFVSHAWLEPIKLFLACLRRHAAIRELSVQALPPAYWVCAYANNQHSLEGAMSDNPRKTSFYKAMQLCCGVLLVLDSNATPFSRIWCCFEESIAVEHLNHDIVLSCITNHSRSCWSCY